MKVVFASDHAGFEYKKELLEYVECLGVNSVDVGAHHFEEGDDYPEFISNAAREVATKPDDTVGIILGGSGQGEAIVANRFKGVRAIVYNAHNTEIIRLGREHNDANVLSIGARFVSLDQAKEAVKMFLNTPFSDEERHIRRIEQIKDYS